MLCNHESQSFVSAGKRWLGAGPAAAVLGALAVLSHAPAAQAAELSGFGACQIKLPAEVAATAQCATLTVLENPAKPNSRRLQLPLLKLRSASATPGAPVFVLNGGPGRPNLGSIRKLSAVQADRDIYYLGYRGADGPDVLNCPEIDALTPAPHPFAEESRGKLTDASRACAARLRKSGYDLRRYTMLDVITDLEAARTALDLQKIDLVSSSYGTRLAQIYARRHPGRIERSVMMATFPPGHFVFSAYANDKIIRRLAELCSADPACAAKSPDLRRTILNALSLHARGVSPTIDDDKTRLALFGAFYSRGGMLAFIKAAQAAEAGDSGPLEALVKAGGGPADIWGDLLSKGQPDTRRYDEMRPTFATTSESMGSPPDIMYEALGRGWPQIPFPEEYTRVAYDDTETLVLNGDIDVASPDIFIEAELMPHLRKGQLVLLKDYGHIDLGRLGPKLGQAIAGYLRTGQVDRTLLQPDPFKFQ